ncbi:MAG: hypothetical protein PVI23_09745 [Maricaulaceae bacterium]|jgi:hypothetical protein
MMRNAHLLRCALTSVFVLGACSPGGGEGDASEVQQVSEDTLAAIADARAAGAAAVREAESAGGAGEAAPAAPAAAVTFEAVEVPREERIDGARIGPVRPGDSLAHLQVLLGDAPVRFVEDYAATESAVCVADARGDELYCALIARTAQPSPDAVISAAVTRHPRLRTAAGVGPGVSLEHAEEVYGAAVLSRAAAAGADAVEYVDFDDGPPGTISFRPIPPRGPGYAGVYDDAAASATGLLETETYAPGSIIGAVEVRTSRR